MSSMCLNVRLLVMDGKSSIDCPQLNRIVLDKKKRHETLSVLCQSHTLQLESSLGEARILSFGFP